METADLPAQPNAPAGTVSGQPLPAPQSRAQVSDNLRMLAAALQTALAQLSECLAGKDESGALPAAARAEAAARLSALVGVLELAGADEAAGMLSMTRDALYTDLSAVAWALRSLQDYLDALFDKSGDTDVCNLLLFTACRRLDDALAEQVQAAVSTDVADHDKQAVPMSAARFGNALALLHADRGYRSALGALHGLKDALADAPGLAFAQDFIGHLIAGKQPLEPQAVAVLDSLGVLLNAETTDPVSVPVRIALARRRIDFLQALAQEQIPPGRGAGETSQQMLRLMLLADELQIAWDRCASSDGTAAHIGAVWQWCESVLRAAALSRRIWPRLRGAGLSGFLAALGRLAFDLATSPRTESRDRELSNCLIFFEECVRRRLYLEDDFPAQTDCIVDHLALLAYGDAEPEPFPWFSRELRADMARRMEGVLEREIRGEVAQVQKALETLWSPVYIEAVRAAQATPGTAPGVSVSPQALIADIHAELAQIEDLSSHLRCAAMREQASELKRHLSAQLPATLRLYDDPEDERARRRGDALRAGMVRDLVRLDEALDDACRSPQNKWRRHFEERPPLVGGGRLADEIRRALDHGDAPPAAPAIAAPALIEDDEFGAWQPEDDDPDMLQVFLAEARQLLDALQADLLRMARGDGQIGVLTAVRRSFHTLKGSGRMVGLLALSDAAHAVEMLLNTCLAVARDCGGVVLSDPVMELLRQAHLRIDVWVLELSEHGRSRRQAPSLAAAALALRNEIALLQKNADPPATEAAASVMPVVSAVAEVAENAEVGASLPVVAQPGGDARLREIFLAEARQLFKALRQHGSSWRAKADSGLVTGAPPLYLRAAHTLRGCSSAAGFGGMQQVAGVLDDVLEQRKAESSGFDADELACVERAVAAMNIMLEQYVAGGTPDAPMQVLQELAMLRQGAARSVAPVSAAPVASATSLPLAPSSSLPAEAVELQDEIDHDLLPVFLEEGHELMDAVGEGLQQFRRDHGDKSALAELRRPLHTVKGSARMAGALRLGHCMHELESGIQRLVSGQADAPGIDALLSLYDRALMQFDALEQLSAVPRADVPVAVPGRAMFDGERRLASPLVRIKAALLDRLLNQVGEVSIARSQLENEVLALHRGAQELADNIARLTDQLRDIEIQAEIQIAASHQVNSESAQFDPLELDRFTHFQELTRMMAESVNDAASLQKQLLDSAARTQDGLQMQERLTRELQRELMYVRMVKFKSVGQRLQHLARQLASETGKQLELEIAGEDMEIDRGILERLVGPLEHLLRNAVVHGIEDDSDARIAAGKPATGKIVLQAAQEGNEAVIRMSDDGRGLDLAAIGQQAAQLGLAVGDISAGDAEGADVAKQQSRLSELIFEPGLTTSSQVSELAGRGVGMDVVRAEVTALGGRISVQSQPGAGAHFTMHLPLSLAVKQVCLLRHGAQHYAIPSILIDKVVQLRGAEMRRALDRRVVEVNGGMVALHSLHSLLDEPLEEGWLPPTSVFVLFVKSGEDLAAIMVDHVSGNREVVAKPLGPQLNTLVGVVGATVLGSGEIALIINPLLLARRLGGRRIIANGASQSARTARKVVMVVDDSMTVRKVMQRLLAREGYAVVTATDGYDAIARLHDITPDMFLVDIEMPRMDGFKLVRHLRDNQDTRAKPIVMITSRTGAKHRERAMEVGVNYYLGKPYQDEQLLELVRNYTGSAGERAADDFSDVLY